uniref:DUF4876 domain-containing protein n=1 Tax=Prevotella sp. GTC17253 TaxID=3236793 RepID=A0AB33IS76_9BACT
MKKIINLLLLTAAVFMASCGDEASIPQYHNLKITLNPEEALSGNKLAKMKLVATSDYGITQEFSLSGDTTINLLQGQYTLVLSGKVADEAAAYVSGNAETLLFADATSTINLSKIIKSPLIFKSIYTTGGQQGYILDQYFEIVNNSDEVQYLDGLMLSAPQGGQTKENAWQAHGYADLYACGQGMVIAFPGSGKEYPLQPGQSIVLANEPVDHAAAAKKGNHCPDLSKADWEVYIKNVKGEVDHPTPDVKVIFQNSTTIRAFGIGVNGRAYLMAKCPEDMTPEEFAADPKNIMTTPGTTAKTQFLMIPSKYVLDAVDIWNNKRSNNYGAFLPKDDAQGVLASTANAGKCVRRKVTKIINGRAYYQDTNNSANDFLNNQELTPGQTPTSVDQ